LQASAIPLLEARMLLEHVTGKNRTWLVAHGDELAPLAATEQFRNLSSRRILGEPMAYLIGEREFFGLSFKVNTSVLIPRPETELLVQWTIDHAPRNASILELGTGSGCIAISIAQQRRDLKLVATDISVQALEIARNNAQAHAVTETIQMVESNWYSGIEPSMTFDLIISNPPYIASNDTHLEQGDLRYEPTSALTDHADGMSCIEQIISGAALHLKPSGWLAFEHGFDQGDQCRALLLQTGFVEVATLKDWEDRDRISLGKRSVE
jgi:release factor glutamine methyltransferase